MRPDRLIKVSPHPVGFSSQREFFFVFGGNAGLLISTGSRELQPLSGLCLLIFPRHHFLSAAHLIRLQCKYPYLTESCLSRPTWTAHYNMARRQHADGGQGGARRGLSRERRKETWTNKFPTRVYPHPSDGVKNEKCHRASKKQQAGGEEGE